MDLEDKTLKLLLNTTTFTKNKEKKSKRKPKTFLQQTNCTIINTLILITVQWDKPWSILVIIQDELKKDISKPLVSIKLKTVQLAHLEQGSIRQKGIGL